MLLQLACMKTGYLLETPASKSFFWGFYEVDFSCHLHSYFCCYDLYKVWDLQHLPCTFANSSNVITWAPLVYRQTEHMRNGLTKSMSPLNSSTSHHGNLPISAIASSNHDVVHRNSVTIGSSESHKTI